MLLLKFVVIFKQAAIYLQNLFVLSALLSIFVVFEVLVEVREVEEALYHCIS